MAHLTLNGVEVLCASARRTPVPVGGIERAFDGTPRQTRRAAKREWAFTTVPLPLDEAMALRGLVEGLGEHWSFDADLYSDAGVGTSLLNGTVTPAQGPGSLVGQGKYLTASGYPGEAEWAVRASPDWTVLATVYRFGHVRLLMRSDGATWRGGVRADTEPARRIATFNAGTGRVRVQSYPFGGANWASGQTRVVGSWCQAVAGNGITYAYEVTAVTGDGKTGASAPVWPTALDASVTETTAGGSVTWTMRADTSGAGIVGDLAYLPYLVPSAWVSPLNTFLTARPWSPLPRLYAAGDFAGGAELLVEGEVQDAKVVEFQQPSGWAGGEVITFVLREV